MNSTRTVAVRLDNQVAQEYERLAQLKGDKLGTYLRDLLTSNLQMASIERQASRIETLVNDFEKQINYSLDKFTEANYLNEKFFEDFGYIYVSNWDADASKSRSRRHPRNANKEMHMPKRTILRGKSHEQYYSTF
jgi:hypothetical protein